MYQQEEVFSCCEIEDYVLVFWNPGQLKSVEFSEEETFLASLIRDVLKLIGESINKPSEEEKFMTWLKVNVLELLDQQRESSQVSLLYFSQAVPATSSIGKILPAV